ncbi:hypothetical protein AFB00_16440 [Pseudonocardia sp. HH130630-07]|nr:hypothetical protein AFB00_16440 [Pseudonocardia sp. HH130630-07]
MQLWSEQLRCNLRDLLTQKLAGQVEKGSLFPGLSSLVIEEALASGSVPQLTARSAMASTAAAAAHSHTTRC